MNQGLYLLHPRCRSLDSFGGCLPSQAAVEYFRLMLPPWDTKGGPNRWLHMEVISRHA